MATHSLNISFDANMSQLSSKIDGVMNDLSKMSREMDKISKSASSMSRTTRAFEKQEKGTKDLSKSTEDLYETIKKLQKENTDLTQDLKKQEKQTEDLQKEIRKLDKQMDNTKNTTKQTTQANDNWISSYSESLKLATRSTLLWAGATTAIYGTKRALEQVGQAVIAVDAKMVDLKKVMPSGTGFGLMQSEASELAKEYATSMEDVIGQMFEWGKQGKEQAEVIQLVETSLVASNATNLEAGEAVSYIVSAMSQFNITAEDSLSIVDKYNETANNFANTTARDLAESVKEAGKAADGLGISLDQLIGMTTAVGEATAKSGNRVGRSLRTIFANMSETTGSLEEYINGFEEWIATAENVDGNELSIALRTSKGEYRDMFSVLEDLSKEWENLSSVQQKQIAGLAGNKRRYSDFSALISNFGTAIDATSASIESMGSALDENERYIGSIKAQFIQAKSAFESMSVTIGDNGLNKVLIGIANSFESIFVQIEDLITGVSLLNEELNGLLGTIAKWGTITATIAGTAKVLGGLAGTFSRLASIVVAGKFSLLATTTTGILGTITSITSFLAGWPAILAGVATVIGAIGFNMAKNEKHQNKINQKREQFNELLDESTKLSYNSASALMEEVANMNNLLAKHKEYRNLDEGDRLMGGIFWKNTPTDELIDMAKELENVFPKLDKFNSKIAKASYIEDRIEEVNKKFEDMKTNLQESTKYTDMNSSEFVASAKKMGESLKKEVIDKFIDLRDKIKEINEDTIIELGQAGFKKDIGMITDNLEFQEEKLDIFEGKISSLLKLRKDIIKAQDNSKELNISKEKILEEINNRLKDTSNLTDEQEHTLRSYQSRLNSVNGTGELYNQILSVTSALIGDTHSRTEDLEKNIERIKDKQEEYNGIFKDFKSHVEDVVDRVGDLGTKFKEVGTNLQNSFASISTFGQGSKSIIESRIEANQEAISDYKSLWEDVNKIQNNGVKNLSEFKENFAEKVDISKLSKENQSVAKEILNSEDTSELNENLSKLKANIEKEVKSLRNNIEGLEFDLSVAEMLNLDTTVLQDNFNKNLDNIDLDNNINKEAFKFNIFENQAQKMEEEISMLETQKDSYIQLWKDIQKELNSENSDKKSIVGLISEGQKQGFLDDKDVKELQNKLKAIGEDESAIKTIGENIAEKITESINSKIKSKTKKVNVLSNLFSFAGNFDLDKPLKNMSKGVIEDALFTAKELGDGNSGDLLKSLFASNDDLNNYSEYISKEFINKLESELNARGQQSNLQSVFDKLASIADFSEFNHPILDGTAKQNTDLLKDSLGKVEKKMLDVKLDNFSYKNKGQLTSYKNNLEEFINRIKFMDKIYKDVSLAEVFDLTALEKKLENTGKLESALPDEAKINEIQNNFNQTLTKAEKLKAQMKEAEQIWENAPEGWKDKAKTYFDYMKEQLSDLKQTQNEDDFLKGIEKNLEGVNKLIENTSVSDLSSIKEAKAKLDELTKGIEQVNRLESLSSLVNPSDEVLTKMSEKTGKSKKEIKALMEEINGYIQDTQSKWRNAIFNGLNSALNNFDPENTTFVEGLKSALRNVLSETLDFTEGENELKDLANSASGVLGKMLNIGEKGQGHLSEGIMGAVNSFAGGSSTGKSVLSGVGAGIGSMFGMPQIGAQVGNFVGGIGEMLFGGDKGRSKDAVKALEEQVDSAKDYLKDYNIDNLIPDVRSKDTASWWRKMFGGSNIKIFNGEEIKEQIERIKGILKGVGSSISSTLADSIGQSRTDFANAIESSLGQQLKESLISSIMEQAFIKEAQGRVTKVIARITKDGTITDNELKDYKEVLRDAQNDFRKGQEQLDKLEDVVDLDQNVEKSNSQTFTAGSTTNYTFNNQYVVDAGAFMGDREDAERFAEYLAPFIQEQMAKAEGTDV